MLIRRLGGEILNGKRDPIWEELFDLTGKVALVTGATKGLGKEMASVLAEAGAEVGLCSRSQEESEAVARSLAAGTGRRVLGLQADVRKSADVQRLVGTIVKDLGPIDILVASAGINIRKTSEELSEADWDAVIGTNLTGAFLSAQTVLPAMRQRGYGRVVFLGSILSFVSIAGRAAYASSKAALLGLTRTLALENARCGVCVNALCPGPFDTPMNQPIREDPEKYRAFIEKIPVGRWGNPREIRGITLFLCSPACSFVTGSTLTIDGGWTAQ